MAQRVARPGKGYRGGAWVAYSRQDDYAGGPALPPAPTDLAATAASDTAIDLAWEAGGDGAATFAVERGEDAVTFAEIDTTAGDTTEYSDTGLDPETEYTYRVRALNQAGYSAYSDTDSATTEMAAPAAPTGLAATATSDTTIDLDWAAGVGGGPVEEYAVERGLDGVAFVEIDTTDDTTTAYGDTGLTPETEYFYRVRARNADAASAYSATDSATTEATP